MLTDQATVYRFGEFTFDAASGDLWRDGEDTTRLQPQPLQVLLLLLREPGRVVSRHELRSTLWPQDIYIEFDDGLNHAIRRLREVLGDTARVPRFIETVPKKGYRFIAQVEPAANGADLPAATSTISPTITATVPSNPKPVVPRNSSRWPIAVAITLVLAIVAGALYWLYRPGTPVVTAVHQLTRTGRKLFDATLFHGSFPATDGVRVYFVEEQRLAQVSTRGGDASYLDAPLLKLPAIQGLSDDSSELLVEDGSAGTDHPFWLVPVPDGAARRIPGKYMLMALLPGSDRIVYVQFHDRTHLLTAKRDGSDPRPLMTLPGEIGTSLAISPDGRRVRFMTADSKMWESQLDGGGMHRFLPQVQEPVCCGKWSPDGKMYIFAAQEQGVYDLWAVEGSSLLPYRSRPQPVRLTNGPIQFQFATVNKDGRRIFALGETQRGELSVFDESAGVFRKFLNGISAGYVNFSRDGQWVTYVSHPQGDLWRSRIDGSERLQLASPRNGSSIIGPQWSPDGRFIAFTEFGGYESRIYLVSVDGGAPLVLLAGNFQPVDPSWSPDGKSLAYGGSPSILRPGVRTEIRIVNLETRQSKTIHGSQGLYSPRWSPDGRHIVAVLEEQDRLFLYSFETDCWTPIPVPDLMEWPIWSRDSRFLYATAPSNGYVIYRVQISNGNTEIIVGPAVSPRRNPASSWLGWFGLTPDDRIIAMIDRGTQEIYALDVNWP